MVLQHSVETFMLPDLFSHHSDLLLVHTRVNRHHKQVARETKHWLFKGANLGEEKRCSIDGLKHGLFAARTYPYAALPQLRVCTDFLADLFFLDDISDDMDHREAGTITDIILNSLYHPHSYSPDRVGKMARECVLITRVIVI